jgi:hypothetical protein
MATCGSIQSSVCAQCGAGFVFTVKRGPPSPFCPMCKDEALKARNRRNVAACVLRQNGGVPPYQRPRAPTVHRKEPHPCKRCGSITQQPMYCSDRCRHISNGTVSDFDKVHRECLECGSLFTARFEQNTYCTAVCSRRRNNRKASAMRRARMRDVARHYFDPVDVLRRDGWRCHLCGIRTPEKLRGTYQPNAPELDHIVPLSVGGEHSPTNTACACRKCNLMKAGKPLGQMRLVA